MEKAGSKLVTIVYQLVYAAPKNNLSLRIKTEPITAGADATVYHIWLIAVPDTVL